MSSDYTLPEEARIVARDIAKEFRAVPDHWTQGINARNAIKDSVAATSPEAVCWCLRGAIDLRIRPDCVDFEHRRVVVYRAFDVMLGHPLPPPYMMEHAPIHITTWNDAHGRTIEEVIELCDKVANF